VLHACAGLLTSRKRNRIRECQADNCAWLFMDHSRNQSRRWCDMKVCGNREKARRFYRRNR
jgi:predicted RNA-binding Zn ribbon-like protein